MIDMKLNSPGRNDLKEVPYSVVIPPAPPSKGDPDVSSQFMVGCLVSQYPGFKEIYL